MDFSLTPEQELIRASAREFCEREIVPHARDWDRAEEMDRGIVAKLPGGIVTTPRATDTVQPGRSRAARSRTTRSQMSASRVDSSRMTSLRLSLGLYTVVGEDHDDLVARFRALQSWMPGGALDRPRSHRRRFLSARRQDRGDRE